MTKFDKYIGLPLMVILTFIPVLWITLVGLLLCGPKDTVRWLKEQGILKR